MKKYYKLFKYLNVIAISFILTSCTNIFQIFEPISLHISSFEEKCITTNEGFKYFVDDDNLACLIEFPNIEKIIIPKELDGIPIKQFGYFRQRISHNIEYRLDGSNVRELTIQHQMEMIYFKSFKLEKLILIDLMEWLDIGNMEELHFGGVYGKYIPHNILELRITNAERKLKDDSKINTIYIGDGVEIIEHGTFANLPNCVIKTIYESKPDGWEDGWNGDCIVEWGIEYDY